MVESPGKSSGIYDGDYGAPNYGSTASLTGMSSSIIMSFLSHLIYFVANAQNTIASTTESRFSEGHEATTGHGLDSSTLQGDPAGAAAPQEYKPPFYLRRWFFVTGIILGALGLALLFVILYPVVKAIAQLVVNRSVLNVDQALISNPQNGS